MTSSLSLSLSLSLKLRVGGETFRPSWAVFPGLCPRSEASCLSHRLVSLCVGFFLCFAMVLASHFLLCQALLLPLHISHPFSPSGLIFFSVLLPPSLFQIRFIHLSMPIYTIARTDLPSSSITVTVPASLEQCLYRCLPDFIHRQFPSVYATTSSPCFLGPFQWLFTPASSVTVGGMNQVLSVGFWSCLLALMAGSAVCLDGAVFFCKRRPLLRWFGVLGLLLDWALVLFMFCFLLFSISVYSSPSWAWVVLYF